MKMKALLLCGALALCLPATAQVKIGNNPQTIDPASLLELESTDRVLVITRVSTAQMEAIAPSVGALVFNTDAGCLYYYDGAQWVNICESLPIAFDTRPIVNPAPSIVITPLGDTLNFEVARNGIRSENIVDFSIGSQDIQNNAINDQKLAPNSVGTEELQDNTVTDDELDYGDVTLADFTNDAGFITAANVVSADPGNDLTPGGDGGAYFDAEPLEVMIFDNADAIAANTAAIAADGDRDATNEFQDLAITGNTLSIANGNSVDLTFLNNAGSDDQVLALTGTDLSIEDGNTVSLAGLEESAEITANTTLINNHIAADGDLSATNEIQNILEVLTDGNDAGALQIKNVADPTDPQDAATRAYVDSQAFGGAIVSTDANNSITAGTDGGAFYEDLDPDPTNEIQNIAEVLADGNDAGATQIKNIADPTDPQDAATRAYVDSQVAVAGTIVSTDINNSIVAGGDGGSFYNDPDNDPLNEIQNISEVLTDGNDAGGLQIKNLADPTDPQDAATRQYVDDIAIAGGSIPNDELITSFTLNLTSLEIVEGTNTPPPVDLDLVFATDAELAALSVDDADADPSNELQNIAEVLTDGNDAGAYQIKNVADPTDPQDAATRAYVDSQAFTGVIVSADLNNSVIAGTDGGGFYNDPDDDPANEIQNIAEVLADGNDAGASQIKNVADPTDPQDAATRAYVDSQAFTGVIVSADLNNSVITGTDGGAFYNDPDDDPANEIQNIAEVLADGNDAGASQIKNVADPTDPQDAATRAYVDAQVVAAGTIVSTDLNNSVIAGTDGGGFYNDPDDDPANEIQNIAEVLADGNDAGTSQIKNIADPTDPQDAATRAYVDAVAAPLTGTTGSIFFADGAGNPSENNTQLFWNNNNTRLGIGTNNPDVELDVANGQVRAISFSTSSNGLASNPAYRFENDANSGMFLATTSELAFTTGTQEAIRIDASQNVGIGTPTPAARLHVIGDIIASGDITANNFPDYVFQSYFTGASSLKPDYQMPSLAEVRDFVAKYHHLPGVTSAAEVKAQGGIILNEATTQNLEKIEELFLHTIEQEAKIEALQQENAGLSKELEAMKARMARIEAMLNQKSGQ